PLARTRDEAVQCLRKKRGPPHGREKRVPPLIEELESPSFKTRQRATEDLERMGQAARPFLERALAKKPPPETRKRVEDLLKKLQDTTTAYELRQMRIIDVLEHINTAAARELLKEIADGKYDPTFAGEAKQALRRATEKR